jgi:hypothetical protein
MFTADGRNSFFKSVLCLEKLRRAFVDNLDAPEDKDRVNRIFREASKTAYFLSREDQSKPAHRPADDDTLEVYP